MNRPRAGSPVDLRAVALFVVLDLATYALLYWLVVPSFQTFLDAIEETTASAIGWVLSAVRLTLVSVVVIRSYRRRRGFDARGEVVATMVAAAGSAWVVQLTLGVATSLVAGYPAWHWRVLVDLVLWVGFALLALVFVSPGEPERLPLRYRAAVGDRGATNLLLVPAVVAIVAGTLLVVTVLGSATNDEREARTAADAAALAAADQWRDGVRSAFDAARWSTDPVGFWRFAGTDLGALGSPAVVDAARGFALANDAELLEVSLDAATASVTVRVRTLDPVPRTGDRTEQRATAELVLRSGVCRSGSRLGYLVGSTCRTSAPPPAPVPTPSVVPTPDPSASPTPTPTPPPPPPFSAPSGIGAFLVDTRLAVTR